MTRPLQKKKNKSSRPRVRQRDKARPAKPTHSNEIVAANWHPLLSLSENFQNLGLTSKLNGPTGGVEKSYRKNKNHEDRLTAFKRRQKQELEFARVRVVRDEVTGAIKEIVKDEATGEVVEVEEKKKKGSRNRTKKNKEKDNPLNDPLNDLSPPVSDNEEAQQQADGPGSAEAMRSLQKIEGRASGVAADVVAQLEAAVKAGEKRRTKVNRPMSQREKAWLIRLVEVHGEDYGAMMRDRTLNEMQQSEGQLRGKVNKMRKDENTRKEGRLWKQLKRDQWEEEARIRIREEIEKEKGAAQEDGPGLGEGQEMDMIE